MARSSGQEGCFTYPLEWQPVTIWTDPESSAWKTRNTRLVTLVIIVSVKQGDPRPAGVGCNRLPGAGGLICLWVATTTLPVYVRAREM